MSSLSIQRTAATAERLMNVEALALARAVAKHFGLELSELLGNLKRHADARAMLYAVAWWKFQPGSIDRIARMFGVSRWAVNRALARFSGNEVRAVMTAIGLKGS